MTGQIKLGCYGVLVILAIWFGLEFRSNYSAVSAIVPQGLTNDSDTGPRVNQPALPATNAGSAAASQTNAAIAETNAVAADTNAAPLGTNAAGTNAASSDTGSNMVGQATNTAPTNAASPAPTNITAKAGAVPTAPSAAPTRPSGAVGYLAAFVIVLIALGSLIAYDATQFVGHQSVEFLFNDRGEGMREPEYEKAEQVWANGHYLEAIQLMRDYLKKNRREQYVALRIAEIYEKDLKNHLAAALEYEEILKKKLPNERWGWAAIHLCNLYNKMSQPAKATALLERIADEYPKTAAAKKARKRLGQPDPEEEEGPQAEPEPAVETPEMEERKTFEITNPEGEIIFEEEAPEEPPPPPPPEASSGLPPGFRPKK